MKNKKGQAFTLIAIALILLFFASYEIYSMVNERQSIKTRITTMDTFLFSIEQNLERQLYIAGFRIIFLAEKEISEQGEYIPEFSTAFFDEAINQGTVNGENEEILDGVTLNEIVQDIQDKADKMNLNLQLTNTQVSIGQDDPWNVYVLLEGDLILQDKSGLASWNKQETIKAYVSIQDFEDPLYLISTNGLISRKINKTTYEGNYVSGADVTNLLSHLQRKLYTSHEDAPSFIDRIEGNLVSSENGIESFIYLPDLSAQGMPIEDKSIVDHVYFSSSDPTSYQITGMPSWAKIDQEHLNKYQVSGLTI